MLTKKKLNQLKKNIKLVVFDFDGVFTDNRVLTLEDGTEGVFCNRSDGFGISLLKKNNIHYVVISKERNPVVSVRCAKLKIPCIQCVDDKLAVLKEKSAQWAIPLEQIAYLGNDINDVECLKAVGLPAVVADAYPPILKYAKYITKTPGGYGAVREFCDFLLGENDVRKL